MHTPTWPFMFQPSRREVNDVDENEAKVLIFEAKLSSIGFCTFFVPVFRSAYGTKNPKE